MQQELSEATKKLIKEYHIWHKSLTPEQEVPTVHVDEVALKVAAFYEHIRTVVEWKEEHLMRRSAIIRKLKRRFFDLELNNFSETDGVAEALVFELIRGGHFPNDKIEETKIQEVQKIVDKYVFILKNNPENKKGKAGLGFYNWLLELAACEIEETLTPPIKEIALIDFMFRLMKEKIRVSDSVYEKGVLKKEDTDVQIYIAVQEALFKLDKPMLSYNLIKYKYPDWPEANEDLMVKIAQDAFLIYNKIEQDLTNPFQKRFYAICEKYDTPYLLLGDVLSSQSESDIVRELSNPATLEGLIKGAYLKRLATLKERITRAAVYSTISIFVTKILSLVLIEVIVSEIMAGELNKLILVADVLIPTILMFILVTTVKKPSSKNLSIVVVEAMKIVYKTDKTDVYEIKMQRKKGVMTTFILSLIYVLSSFASFGFIYWIFNEFGFPLTSIIINIVFIALILFTGTAVRKRAQELTIEDEKEGFISFLSDVFFLPVQGLGKWISTKWKKYNAIAAFFNALIDMPFSAFVEFLEKWRYFIKDRKEEIR